MPRISRSGLDLSDLPSSRFFGTLAVEPPTNCNSFTRKPTLIYNLTSYTSHETIRKFSHVYILLPLHIPKTHTHSFNIRFSHLYVNDSSRFQIDNDLLFRIYPFGLEPSRIGNYCAKSIQTSYSISPDEKSCIDFLPFYSASDIDIAQIHLRASSDYTTSSERISPPTTRRSAHVLANRLMAPNLYLCVRKLFHPMEWIPQCRRHKRSEREFLYCAEPVPGIYGVYRGRRYLVAIRPIRGQKDNEHIFAPMPRCDTDTDRHASCCSMESAPAKVLRQSIDRRQRETSRTFPKCKGISPIDLGGYRYLYYSVPVVYSEILRRWIFKGELDYRDVIYHDAKNYGAMKMHFFRLDHEAYIFLGFWKNGRTTVVKDHMGINEVLWIYDEEKDTMVETTPAQETQIRMKMARSRPEILSADGEDDFMKVVRYIRKGLREV
ncbi:hypothetical protein CJF32_00003480 [Rutstroemia sp. NJR-2017a WRK4]|nr:hypothetical protein CJF32_00003480 [Rutstroemia sp. NJR-2017a WRK4]